MKRDDQEFLSDLMDGEWQTLDVRRAIAEVCSDAALREKWSRYHLARHAMQREPLLPGGSLAERIARAIDDEPTYSNVTAIGGGAPGVAGAADAAFAGEAAATAEAAAPVAIGRHGAAAAASGPPTAPSAPSGPPASVAPSAPRAATARTFAAGFGLAASVAVVTAFGLNALSAGDAAAPGSAGARVADAGPLAGPLAGDPERGPVVADPFTRRLSGALLPDVELVSNDTAPGAYWIAPGSSARRAGSEERLNMLLSQHIENSPTSERQGMLPYSRLVGYDERTTVGR